MSYLDESRMLAAARVICVDLIRAAVEKERDACAEVADRHGRGSWPAPEAQEYDEGYWTAAADIAATIRARGEKGGSS